MHFIDRHLERSALADAWASGRSELVVVHGRRRVGKSELLSRWAAGKPVVYFVAAQQLERDQLADLGRVLGPLVMRSPGPGPVRISLDDWDGVLDAVAAAAAGRPKTNTARPPAAPHQPTAGRVVWGGAPRTGPPTRRIHLHPFDYFHAA